MPLFRKDGRYVLFVHIPKCAGSSVTRAFRDSGWEVDLHDGSSGPGSMNHVRPCAPQHWHASLLRRVLQLKRIDLTFSFIRHPVERLRSEYLWRHRGRDHVDLDAGAVERWTLKGFARWSLGQRFLYDNHLRPQSQFLVRGAQLMRVEDGVENQLAALSDRYDLQLTAKVGHALRSTRMQAGMRSRDVTVSPRLARAIRVFYHRDFARLGYREADRRS